MYGRLPDQTSGVKYKKGMIKVANLRIFDGGKGGGRNGGSGGGTIWDSPELQYPEAPPRDATPEEMEAFHEKSQDVKRKRMELGRRRSEERQRRESPAVGDSVEEMSAKRAEDVEEWSKERAIEKERERAAYAKSNAEYEKELWGDPNKKKEEDPF